MSLPSPSLPPKVPTRSLAPVVLALLIGVAVIVVVIIKMSSSSKPAPEPEVASTAAQPSSIAATPAVPAPSAEPPPPPPSSEPPPPPPPSNVAGAPAAGTSGSAPRAAASATAKTGASGARAPRDPGCAAPCQGSATDQLVRALGAKAAGARACYERALANDSGLSGKLEIAVRVSPAGSVCSATPSSDTLKDPEVLACVLRRLESGILPKPTGGCVDTSVPINFKPAGAG